MTCPTSQLILSLVYVVCVSKCIHGFAPTIVAEKCEIAIGKKCCAIFLAAFFHKFLPVVSGANVVVPVNEVMLNPFKYLKV